MKITNTKGVGKKNERLYNIMMDSLYPFKFNIDSGKDLQKSYTLIYKSYIIARKNQFIFQSVLGWNNKEYLNYLNTISTLCDQIYMLTHTYLRYQTETQLFNNILSEVESLYFTLFNDEHLILKSDQINQHYNKIKEISKVYNKLRLVYTIEMDKLLMLDDRFKKKYDLEKKEICALHIESKERREQD